MHIGSDCFVLGISFALQRYTNGAKLTKLYHITIVKVDKEHFTKNNKI